LAWCSSSATALLAVAPKIARGLSSGVTIVVESSMLMSYARPALISASS
jgi:hypothetical protein